MQVQFSGRTLAFQAGCEGPIPFTCSIGFHSSAGQSNALLRQRSKVRILLGAPVYFYGGLSSVGRTPDCGSGGQGFDPLRSPHIYLLLGCRQVVRHWILIPTLRRFESYHPSQKKQTVDDDGVSPSGKAQDFDSCMRRFKSCHPSQTKTYTLQIIEVNFSP